LKRVLVLFHLPQGREVLGLVLQQINTLEKFVIQQISSFHANIDTYENSGDILPILFTAICPNISSLTYEIFANRINLCVIWAAFILSYFIFFSYFDNRFNSNIFFKTFQMILLNFLTRTDILT